MRKFVPITEDEHVQLMKDLPPGVTIHTTLGPDVRLIVDTDKPHTFPAAKYLMAMRGISNQNCNGAGI